MSDTFIEVGVLAKPHGLKGEIRVHAYTESLDVLRGDVYLQAGHAPYRKVCVRSCRLHQGAPVLRLDGVEDRTAAEGLRGQTLLVPREALPPLDDDECYLDDLMGFAVLVAACDGGAPAPLGKLDHVMFQGEQETWVIMTPDDREVFLPAVPDFVASIDLSAGRIIITPPEGLLELYLA